MTLTKLSAAPLRGRSAAHARAGKDGRGHRFAADMERPVSSPRDQFVVVGPPWGSETTVKAGRFDDESF
jgi:hypothetical protein